MITRMVEERIGEWLGEIDWSYDFASHFSLYCVSAEQKAELIYENVYRLWEVERMHKRGIPLMVLGGNYYHRLIKIGMYDGWPYWRPTPGILVAGPIGAEAKTFPCVDGWKQVEKKK